MPDEPTLSPTDVAFALAQRGIRASRDRIARMSDALYGRDDSEAGRYRRFSAADVDQLAAAFLLVEGGASRDDAARMLRDPATAADQIQVEAEALVTALRRLQQTSQAMSA